MRVASTRAAWAWADALRNPPINGTFSKNLARWMAPDDVAPQARSPMTSKKTAPATHPAMIGKFSATVIRTSVGMGRALPRSRYIMMKLGMTAMNRKVSTDARVTISTIGYTMALESWERTL